jgi:hypothetical protein
MIIKLKNMKMNVLLIKLMTLVFLAASCKKNSSENSDEPSKNLVKGKVTNTRGEPLKGVSILIDNTMFYNTYLSGTTKDDGTYQITLTNGAWQAYAKLNATYNGKNYALDLHPDNPEGFSQEGAVRNFQWKLTGKKPTPLTGNYGATIILDKAISSSIFDSENIEFTLTPSGKLIDGTDGVVLKLKHGLPTTDTYGKLVDIPIGRYVITAKYGNTIIKLRNKLDPASTLSNSLVLDIQPETPIGNNMAVLEYRES